MIVIPQDWAIASAPVTTQQHQHEKERTMLHHPDATCNKQETIRMCHTTCLCLPAVLHSGAYRAASVPSGIWRKRCSSWHESAGPPVEAGMWWSPRQEDLSSYWPCCSPLCRPSGTWDTPCTRADGPSWGRALASAGMKVDAGNHCGMHCTIGQSQLNQSIRLSMHQGLWTQDMLTQQQLLPFVLEAMK